jgi:hypothetical protein
MYKTSKQEAFSIAYISALAAPLGFNKGSFGVDDDSIDIIFSARYDKNSIIRSPQINLQLKCTQTTFEHDNFLHFPLPLKNYEDLRGSNQAAPRYLVVLCVPSNESEWVVERDVEIILRYSAYWFSLKDAPETHNKTTVTILIPKNQKLDKKSFKRLMDEASKGNAL